MGRDEKSLKNTGIDDWLPHVRIKLNYFENYKDWEKNIFY